MLQPCDWYEHDVRGQYVVEVFGRTKTSAIACLRVTGFKPYFYVDGAQMPSVAEVYDLVNMKWESKYGSTKGEMEYAWKLSRKIPEMKGCTVSRVQKYDVFGGFQELKQVPVWKVECGSLAAFRAAKKVFAKRQQYESNLPPFLRLFHDRNLGPASPIQSSDMELLDEIPSDDDGIPMYSVDEFYTCDWSTLTAADVQIPLLVASYDLEMYSASGMFPQASKDPIIQIGVSYRWSHRMLDPVARLVFVLGDVAASDEEGVEFVACRDEKEMLQTFVTEIETENPDILCGYNIFGFDDAYLEGRAQVLGIPFDLSRKRAERGEKAFETKKFELASGKYDLRFMTLRGRLGLDLLLNMRREHSLDSFKLDNVASVFLRDKVVDYKDNVVTTKSTRGLRVGNYVRFDLVGNTTDPYHEGEKYRVTEVTPKGFRIDAPTSLFTDLTDRERKSLEWTFTKDDVEPQELFHLHAHGGPTGRARIAKYCIQDCDLVLTLMAKLDTIVNARGMADVCKVPMEYVLRRGQGIKIFSAVLYYASQRNQIIRVQESMDGDTGYEGAIVISPKIGMYLDQPISVLDFNSLYPTNMIAYNLSPDTLVSVREFNADGHKIRESGYAKADFDRLTEAGYVLDEVEYDNKEGDTVVGKTVCTYVQPNPTNPMTKGVLPLTLDILLKKRKEFKEKMDDQQYDEAQRSVYNGLQLAYKVVANSVYGQTGSRTSPIRILPVAACTTAAGRKALGIARRVVESEFGADVIYGDTDSIFVKFPTKDLAESISLGIAAGKRITDQCRRPYKIAYEKTFYPFILFCRKRYVGMMYEEDPKAKPKRKSMGIVLKRRDNAPIVKDVFGGALDVLLQEKDVKKAQAFVNDMLLKVLENRVPLEKFIVSKSLRDDYVTTIPPEYISCLKQELSDIEKKESHKRSESEAERSVAIRRYLKEGKASYNTLREWSVKYDLPIASSSIAHRTLADRMESRDPGTAPKVGDRLQYIYVAENRGKSKQGDRIEEVGYVRRNGLTPDTQFYITNQIQNPVAQLFALCIEGLDGYTPPKSPSYETLYKQLLEKHGGDEEAATIALLDKKERQLETLMFLGHPTLTKIIKKSVRGPMDAFVRK